MTIVITSTGKGAAISEEENDGNLSSLSGINEAQTGTTYTVVAADQNRTIELSNGSAIAVTLTAISTIIAGIDTDDFKVTLKNIGAGLVTATAGGTDTYDSGGTTITIPQYSSVTIQTDSTQAKWNLLYDYHKTLTNPAIASATFSGTQTGFIGDVTGDLTGNADTATLAATVTTNANLTGDVTSSGNTTTLSSATVGGKIPGIGITGIGSYVFAVQSTGSAVAANAEIAGTSLTYAGVTSSGLTSSSSVGTGTWRCMGVCPNNAATLWLRVS